MATRQGKWLAVTRAERVAAGLCRDCGKDSKGQYRCKGCNKKRNARRREKRNE